MALAACVRWRQCQRHNCAAAGRVPRDRLPRGGLVPGGHAGQARWRAAMVRGEELA